jgi:hypothetical protein
MKKNRREFVKNVAMMAAGTTLVSFDTIKSTQMDAFIHHVYFWLKNPGSKEDLEALLEGLRKLSKIDYIKMFHIGKPADTNRDVIDRSYAVSWMLVFNNKADEERYQTDPVHLNFVATCKHLWERVVVYDSVNA